MKQKKISIESKILQDFPEVAIGYMVVDNLHHIANANITEDLLKIAVMGINENKLSLQNLVEFKTIADWRSTYQKCGVKPKTYKSSVESLLRRFIQNDYKRIINVVDLYNFISAGFILSIGGYNLERIEGCLELRHARNEDKFIPLSGKDDIPVSESHIVYADENMIDNIVCWMWNHKDSKRTMLGNEILKGLFIFDCLSDFDLDRLPTAQNQLCSILVLFGATVKQSGVLSKDTPFVILNEI
jgi:DNA/RNA-binding domain of Phe-tRNA-synthetase-like protein